MRFDEKHIQELKEQGFSVIPNFIEEPFLSQLNAEFNKALEDKKLNRDYSEGQRSVLSRFNKSLKPYPAIRECFYNDHMEDLAFRFYGRHVDLNESIFVVKDVVGSRHIANDLHFDILQTLKFFIYLNDVTEQNGAFQCVPGSQKWTEKLRDERPDEINYENRDISRELPNLGKAIPIEGKAGTLILFNTDVFHRAGFVTEGERRVMRGHTCANDEHRKPNFFGKIKHQIRQML